MLMLVRLLAKTRTVATTESRDQMHSDNLNNVMGDCIVVAVWRVDRSMDSVITRRLWRVGMG